MGTIIGMPVTYRIKTIKQPRGGYIKPSRMEETILPTTAGLHEYEDIHPSLVGLAVDYLTRFMTGSTIRESFDISLRGARIINDADEAERLLGTIKGLDDESIVAAAKLTAYDVCYRGSIAGYVPSDLIEPSPDTCDNIRIMVGRALRFFDQYGPKTKDNLTFEGGYTDLVNAGDGDFMTMDTLWDFKVSKRKPTKEHTLQLLMYWRMGLHSIHPEYRNVRHLGIFNPRLNMVWRISVDRIPDEVIRTVETDVIGYPTED